MKDSFLGPLIIIGVVGKNGVEFRLTEEFSRKHPVLPVNLVKPYHQAGEDKFPLIFKSHTPQEIVEVDNCPCQVEKIMKEKKIRLNGKDHRQYLFVFTNQTADKEKWLEEDSIPDRDLHPEIFRASGDLKSP
ncbi:hypothetical protein O181_030416 [Austropuccinia psidii MF-1]|uniref:Uncharacterized protein n=1 Tax=Austropuccinia psidii MF-1 TaxID=1389203 RepID=A0A9Q3CYF8_9BASI|nr:hypothetical protein [Austropuccinia psidii MF-1]